MDKRMGLKGWRGRGRKEWIERTGINECDTILCRSVVPTHTNVCTCSYEHTQAVYIKKKIQVKREVN